jgi:hypothetical protein
MLNLKFKLTPFWLFIILLAVLIISIVIGINTLKQSEGFVNYAYSTPTLIPVNISGYKNPLIKLYDNNFYDKTNGNLVRVYGSAFTDKAPKDDNGNSLTAIEILTRDSQVKKYTKDKNDKFPSMDESIPTDFISKYGKQHIYNDLSNNQIFHTMWDKKSFIHIIDNDKNIATYLIDNSQNLVKEYSNANNSIINELKPIQFSDDEMSTTNQLISDENNDIFFQILPNILFKKSSGMLYIKNKSGTYDAYDRQTGKITLDDNDTIKSAKFDPWTVEVDGIGLILFIQDDANTVISLIFKTPSTNGKYQYSIDYSLLFDNNGNKIENNGRAVGQPVKVNKKIIANKKAPATTPSATPSATPAATPATPAATPATPAATPATPAVDMPNLKNMPDEYYKWYWYWNTTGGTTLPVHFSEDYLLKTQIVPPVCPSCPDYGKCNSCGSNSSCSKVDNKSDNEDNSKNKNNKPISDSYNKTLDTTSDLLKSTGSGATNLAKETVSETTDLLKSAGSGVSSFIKDSASGIGNFAKDTASGTVGLAKETVSGTVGLAKDTASGTVGLAKDTASGTVGLIKDAGRGTANFIKDTNREQRLYNTTNNSVNSINSLGYNASPVQGSYGVSTTTTSTPLVPGQPVGPMNPYTYNGALSQKPSSNFMPLTADFSKFGR